MAAEENPTWREIHSMVDAKVFEMKRDQDLRIDKLDVKLDRVLQNQNDTRDLLAQSKGVDEFKKWILPIAVSAAIVIIEALNLLKH